MPSRLRGGRLRSVAMVDVEHVDTAPGPARLSAGGAPWIAVGAAAALVGGCAAAGWWLTRHGAHLHQGSAYPVDGRYLPHLSPWLLVPVALGLVIVHHGPLPAGRLAWRPRS